MVQPVVTEGCCGLTVLVRVRITVVVVKVGTGHVHVQPPLVHHGRQSTHCAGGGVYGGGRSTIGGAGQWQ